MTSRLERRLWLWDVSLTGQFTRAIEGATGEWAHLVCSSDRYASSFPEDRRKSGMRWLRAHAHYDDSHPWEALEIIASILGAQPGPREVESVHAAIRRSYEYMRMTLDDCLADLSAVPAQADLTRERAA
ncbi:MAG TPA: hypothetical protein VGR92_18065 [Steroidobacteraceae bacterium]|nr:hypothetical protein [Steroidobacteraceae bacterium]